VIHHADQRCYVCHVETGSREGGPWVCFQSLWIIPGGERKATSVERASGDPFVACHVHCLRMLVQGEMAPPPAVEKPKKRKRGK
jgi:hypothetical protein